MQELYRGGTLVVWAGYDEQGRLALDGQNLGGHPVADEYEYFIRIDQAHFPALREALGTPGMRNRTVGLRHREAANRASRRS